MSLLLLFPSETLPSFDAPFLSGVLPPGLTYTNSSTTRTYWDAAGTRQAAAANVPVFETLGGVFQGMRWEMEARTNLATNSEGAAATWTVSNVTDAGTPIAGFSASLQFGDNSVDRAAYKTLTTTAITYTVSAFVEMDDGSAPRVGGQADPNIDMTIRVGGVVAAVVGASRITGNIYRVYGTATAAAAATTSGVRKFPTNSAKGFRVIGIQVEAAASASSYIPTAAAAVTRQPDVLTASSISWYRQDEGTVLFECIPSTPATTQRGMYLFSDGTDNERMGGYRASGLTGGYLVVDGGVTQADVSTLSSMAQSAVSRHAFAYKVNDFAGSVNGGAPVADAAGTLPTITGLKLGQGNTAGTQAFMGYARRFQYFPTRLPNAQIQGMSRV